MNSKRQTLRQHRAAPEAGSGSVAVGVDAPFSVWGGGQPRSRIPFPLPAAVENGTAEEDDEVWDMFGQGGPFDRCANCHREGHGVAQCMIPRPDGHVHGCSMCNTRDHRTIDCDYLQLPWGEQIDILVRERHNMPPLQGVPWYPMVYGYVYHNPGVDVQEFPWSIDFPQQTLIDPDLGIQAVDAMDTGLAYLQPVDPRTAIWEAVQTSFGGIQLAFVQYLRRVRVREKIQEMKELLRDEEKIGEL
ncbi:hypothetical protein F53441_4230 [Fusarium austroafricanum]|uniref:CCHC-type domain-containing protein n=1 Tax=Fusarium austroafricanum TaxID=2364996 RepID=A0A8H4NVQ6_9HYPO|nr:hypothetical protein F53441_4230 [Fusarium austroafricanum]